MSTTERTQCARRNIDKNIDKTIEQCTKLSAMHDRAYTPPRRRMGAMYSTESTVHNPKSDLQHTTQIDISIQRK